MTVVSTARKIPQHEQLSTDSDSDYDEEERGGENARLLWLPTGKRVRALFSTSTARDVARQLSRSGTCRAMAAAAVAVGWMCVSSLLILVNKHILSDLEFRYPLTVSSMGMFTSGVCSYILCRWTSMFPAEVEVSFNYWLTKIMPVGLFMAATLWTGNMVYLYLSVSFIQMLKAFNPIIVMLALFIAGLETPSVRMMISVMGIALGTALSAYGEVNINLPGLLLMFGSETFEAVRLVMTQLLLTGQRMATMEGLMWLAPACFFWLLLGAAMSELPRLFENGDHVIVANNARIFMVAACTGFAVNLLAYGTIKLASSLTLKVLGCVKSTLVIVLAMQLFAEEVALVQFLGYVVSIAAFAAYTHIKMVEIAAGEVDQQSAPKQ